MPLNSAGIVAWRILTGTIGTIEGPLLLYLVYRMYTGRFYVSSAAFWTSGVLVPVGVCVCVFFWYCRAHHETAAALQEYCWARLFDSTPNFHLNIAHVFVDVMSMLLKTV